MTSWGDRIRLARERRGMSMAQLARRLGLKQPSVHAWESGKAKKLKGPNLLAVQETLQVPVEWILRGTVNGRPTPDVPGTTQVNEGQPPYPAPQELEDDELRLVEAYRSMNSDGQEALQSIAVQMRRHFPAKQRPYEELEDELVGALEPDGPDREHY